LLFTFKNLNFATKSAMKFILNFLTIALFSAYANILQAQSASTKTDFFESTGKIYVVVAVLAVIFIGILFMMYSIEKRLAKIEKEDGDI
jgi:uncharacterized membrane protein